MAVLLLTVRAWLRYVVPLTLLAGIALGPVAYAAWTLAPPVDVVTGRALVWRGWMLMACAIALQFLAVAAAAPAVRALHAGAPLSQLGALAKGLRGIVRGFVPWLTALVAVQLGHTLNCRSRVASAFAGLFDNLHIWAAAATVVAMQAFAMTFGPLARLLGLTSLVFADLAVLGTCALLPIGIVEVQKVFVRARLST